MEQMVKFYNMFHLLSEKGSIDMPNNSLLIRLYNLWLLIYDHSK